MARQEKQVQSRHIHNRSGDNFWRHGPGPDRQLPAVTMDVLALTGELRKGTIERVMSMSGLELGLQALLEGRRPGPR